jgi:hypothetical protein
LDYFQKFFSNTRGFKEGIIDSLLHTYLIYLFRMLRNKKVIFSSAGKGGATTKPKLGAKKDAPKKVQNSNFKNKPEKKRKLPEKEEESYDQDDNFEDDEGPYLALHKYVLQLIVSQA